MNPPIFGKLYPFGVRFQHKTKQRPRNVDRFGHRNRTKPVPFFGWFQGIVPILRPYSKLWARILQHFQMYTCTLFLLLCLPKALHYHLTVYKHVCMVGNVSISANRRICGFTYIQVCCVRKGLKSLRFIFEFLYRPILSCARTLIVIAHQLKETLRQSKEVFLPTNYLVIMRLALIRVIIDDLMAAHDHLDTIKIFQNIHVNISNSPDKLSGFAKQNLDFLNVHNLAHGAFGKWQCTKVMKSSKKREQSKEKDLNVQWLGRLKIHLINY